MASVSYWLGSEDSSKQSSYTRTITASQINTWVSSNIPKYATINSVKLYCSCRKSALSATGEIKVTVGSTTLLAKNDVINSATAYKVDLELKSYVSSGTATAGYINGDVAVTLYGANAYWYCNDMEIVFDYTVHSHTEVTIPAVAPTCTAAGKTEGKKCSACGAIITEQQTIPALGHTAGTPVTENRVEATCTTDGSYDEVVYCTVCGAEISRTKKTIVECKTKRN